ncbi:endoglucanase II [Coprinopsis cinerea AmutBmut pab1-1]|nr:endoglucanase II [Coprinopsis cinerea AmutBmut pab1-1]
MGSESARLSPNSEMHMQVATVTLALWLALLAPFSLAQSICSGAPQPRYPMTLASGWRGGVLLGGLTMPRGIMIDTRGNLLVIQRGRGLTGHALDANGCVTSTKTIIQDSQINHAIDVHPSGNRIMASSGDAVWSWDYDPVTMTATNKRTLITGMNNFIHFTRTIHISRKYPNLFALSVGSESNVDPNETAWIRQSPNSSIRLQQSPFSKSHMGGYGLRNDVGIAEDRAGNIHSIENSLDDAYRMVNGQRRDIHTNNPAEKVYNLGDPSNPRSIFGGYPDCYTVWEAGDFTDSPKQVGDWFVQDPNGQYNDAWCNTNAVKPTALLPPHTAPLDMKFGLGNDTNLYVGLHGSWNRQPPQGYKVVIIPGRYSASGEWSPSVGLAQTKTSFTNLLTNRNENQCSGSFGGSNCFRPVGLVWSPNGENLYVSSDTTGEVFILKRPGGPSVDPPVVTNPPGTPTTPPVVTQPPSTIQPPQATQTMYGQCGGQGWTGPTLCPANAVCRAANQYYSQCVPA